MVAVGRLVVAVAIMGLGALPTYADVIPTRRAGDTANSSQKIEQRLLQLGVSSDAAKEHLKNLTDDQTNYFAANVERIQLVGQENWGGQSDNLWWEWVLGLAALVGVGLFIVFEIHNS
jgi:hypothetical protein